MSSQGWTMADVNKYNAKMGVKPVEVVDKPKNPAKYKSRKVIVDGIEFDSITESKRYIELKQWQAMGIISDLKLQETYHLSVCKYIADFVYQMDGITVVEDSKSSATRKLPVYAIKKKMMLKELGITIKETGVSAAPKRRKPKKR